MADPMPNENIRHTEGAVIPETRAAGQVFERVRADLPAFRAMLTSRPFLISAAVSGILGLTGYFYFRQQLKPRLRVASALGWK